MPIINCKEYLLSNNADEIKTAFHECIIEDFSREFVQQETTPTREMTDTVFDKFVSDISLKNITPSHDDLLICWYAPRPSVQDTQDPLDENDAFETVETECFELCVIKKGTVSNIPAFLERIEDKSADKYMSSEESGVVLYSPDFTPIDDILSWDIIIFEGTHSAAETKALLIDELLCFCPTIQDNEKRKKEIIEILAERTERAVSEDGSISLEEFEKRFGMKRPGPAARKRDKDRMNAIMSHYQVAEAQMLNEVYNQWR